MYIFYSKNYKIIFDSGNYLNLSKLDNYSFNNNIEEKWFIYLDFINNDINKLLKEYTQQKQVKFKTKKEIINLLYNFCNYYNLKYPEIILKESIWLYNNKLYLTKSELHTNNRWDARVKNDIVINDLKKKIGNYKSINKLIVSIDYLNAKGNTRKEAINNLNKIIKEKYPQLEISKCLSLEKFLELYNL